MDSEIEFENRLEQLVVEKLAQYGKEYSTKVDFPSGLCRIISNRFALALSEINFDNQSQSYVVGRQIHADSPDGVNPSHFWLKINGYYLDLTIKQFDSSKEYYFGKDEEVILTAFKTFHNIDEIPFNPWDINLI